ncbi:hypothetical protein ACFLT7_00090 [candidate division KSB1 bacterium]
MSIKAVRTGSAIFFLYLSFLVIAGGGSLQAQTTLTVQVQFTDVQLFHLGDFGLISSGSSDNINTARDPEIFNFSLSSTQYPVTVRLQLQISSRKLGLIATGTSRAVRLTEDVIALSNRDLTSTGNPFKLQNYEMVISADDLREHLGGGLLPADEYRFELAATDVDNPANTVEQVSIVYITNPTTLNLRSPGMDPSRIEDKVRQLPSPLRPPYDPEYDPKAPMDEPDGFISIEDWMEDGRAVLYTTEPMFFWDSQAVDFSLTLWEKTDNLIRENVDVEAVVQTTPFFHQDGISSSVFQFPASGGERGSMREGGIYYYQVRANIPSSRGVLEVESEIYGFSIADMSVVPGASGGAETSAETSPTASLTEILTILQEITGRDLSDQALGWSPTGVVLIDGEAATLDQLRALGGRIEVKDVIVE